jgi:hypothetical protein
MIENRNRPDRDPHNGQRLEVFTESAPPAPTVKQTRDACHTAIPFAQRLSCSIGESCEATGLSRSKLYELIGAGHIDTITIGRRRLVLVRSLQALLDAAGSSGQAARRRRGMEEVTDPDRLVLQRPATGKLGHRIPGFGRRNDTR